MPGYKRCNCKKAKCLKLYCVCFSAGALSPTLIITIKMITGIRSDNGA